MNTLSVSLPFPVLSMLTSPHQDVLICLLMDNMAIGLHIRKETTMDVCTVHYTPDTRPDERRFDVLCKPIAAIWMDSFLVKTDNLRRGLLIYDLYNGGDPLCHLQGSSDSVGEIVHISCCDDSILVQYCTSSGESLLYKFF